MQHRTLLVLLALAASAASARVTDQELAMALRATRERLAAGDPVGAEEVLESLTHLRPRDPRVWLAVGNLRARLGHATGARRAWTRVHELGSERMRDALAPRFVAAGLPVPEDPVVLADPMEFHARGAFVECVARRRGVGPPACPLDGAALAPSGGARGGLVCPNHPPGSGEKTATWRIDGPVLAASLADGVPGWLQVLAVDRVTLRDLLRNLALFDRPRPSALRLVLVRRLWCMAGELSRSARARRLLVELGRDPDPEVRLEAHTLSLVEGTRPHLRAEDLRLLIRRVDGTRASPWLLREVIGAQAPDVLAVLREMAAEPTYPGKALVVRLLATELGAEGRRALEQALVENRSEAMLSVQPLARRLLAGR